ncbi:hypothetical protein UFOVP674_47 [uncultured Caudovirales phage]|uniref:Uncharacterized protein n=1 Tax=uncultured Caudovirales phage TaxID=2100421 RepID=A0A6J5NB49_9CAUD|nr:hypothetical protein UFOVP674_47 [uncultured Caudovirales phage]
MQSRHATLNAMIIKQLSPSLLAESQQRGKAESQEGGEGV